MITTTYLVTVHSDRPLPQMHKLIEQRVYTANGVEDVEAREVESLHTDQGEFVRTVVQLVPKP